MMKDKRDPIRIYQDTDTGAWWTLEEIRTAFNQFIDESKYDNFEDFFEDNRRSGKYLEVVM